MFASLSLQTRDAVRIAHFTARSRANRLPLNDPAPPVFNFDAADPAAAYQAVYAELKRVARSQLRSQSNLTDLPATVLVHESFARMA